MKIRGVITVYLSMIFLLVTALVFTAAESSRVQASRMLMETAADSAMESFFAGYQRELYDAYDLFFFDGALGSSSISREALAGKVEEYMDYNSNIAVFGDHCRAIGIENELILDYTFFDDQDVFVLRWIP